MENFLNVFENKTLPGVRNIIFNKHKFIKIMWIICIIILFSWCSLFLLEIISSYLDYEVITNIDIYREVNSPFPTITFCISTDSPVNDIPPINETMTLCLFEEEECSWEDFEPYTNKLNNICYRFNSGKNLHNQKLDIKNTSRSDQAKGLNVFFYLTNFTFSTPHILSVFIQNQSTIFRTDNPFNINSGILIPAGLTYIKIERNFIEKLPNPYNDCVKQETKEYVSHLFQYFIKNNKTYSQKDCFDLCIEEIMMNKCNCSEDLGLLSRCFSNLIALECIGNLFFAYRDKSLKLPESCSLNCPIECDIIIYRVDQNHFGPMQIKYLEKKNFSKDLNEKGAYMSFYYSNLEYTLLKEIPKTKPYDLVSNFGGTLGLLKVY